MAGQQSIAAIDTRRVASRFSTLFAVAPSASKFLKSTIASAGSLAARMKQPTGR